MKASKLIVLFFVSILFYREGLSQNVSLNVLTQESGIVKKGKTVFFEVSITNTDPANYIGIYKLRVNISIPLSIVSIDTAGHVLPTGWKITGNNGKTITLSNGMDMIAATDARTILIAIRGNKVGGPEPIAGQLSFSDGNVPGTATGTLNGDLPADNYSTSTVQVVR